MPSDLMVAWNPVILIAFHESRRHETGPMKLRWSNLIGLLTASMLPLQLPICVCQGSDHSHASPYAISKSKDHGHHGGRTAALPQHATNDFHERHSGREENQGHHSHSHHEHGDALPMSHEPAGHDCGGHSGGEGHRCECAPQDVFTLPGQGGASLNSSATDSVKWLSHTAAALADTSPSTSVQLLRFWPARSPVTASQGKLCARLCRWLI